jgi:hypothetical protein
MDAKLIKLPGEQIPRESLKIEKARELCAFLETGGYPYAKLGSSIRTADGREGVSLELGVEVGQEPVHDIRPAEPIAILFSATDDLYPDVLSLRGDFPQVPHLNLRETEFPRSLCLYEEPYSVVRLSWTPARFLERIRMWFRDTARGVLHREDQPLEPILQAEPRHLVIPSDLFLRGSEDAPEKLWFTLRHSSLASELIVAKRLDKATLQDRQRGLGYLATTFQTEPQTHGVIRRLPRNLLDVHDLMAAAGLDMLATLRDRMLTWSREEAPLNARLVLLAFFPKIRSAGKPPEVSDIWAFVTLSTIREIGAALGFWQALPNGQVGALIGTDVDRQKASSVEVFVMNPFFAANRYQAALLNGYAPVAMKITAIGVGALGSQVVTKLVRGGFGTWTLIDNDHLLSHNIARHELTESMVGLPKAFGMQMLGNNILEEDAIPEAIVADILRPKENQQQIEAAIKASELVLDLSASVPVARHLSALAIGPRRASAFLNSDATDVVLLAEDRERKVPLDCLEMQYYRGIISNPELTGHLEKGDINRVRYAQTCRDLTSTIPEELVGLHSAIVARAARTASENPSAAITVWRASTVLSVTSVTIVPSAIREFALGQWRLRTDDSLIDRLRSLRSDRLPNETGGVFVGSFDLERKIIYVVDTIPSPPDSTEWPVLYIRGCEGLPERIENIQEATLGMLQYVGEWHSHPDGCSTNPSNDDLKVFSWLTEHMTGDGLPAVMAIVGEAGGISWFVGTMVPGS